MKPSARPKLGLRPRMTTFRRVVATVTLTIHLPFLGAMVELGRRAGWMFPRAEALALTMAGVTLFARRVPWAQPDRRHRSDLVVRFVDIPIYVHWCACLFTIIPAALETVFIPFAQLTTGAPAGLPLGAYLWTYVIGLTVCGYGILVRRRWLEVRRVEVPVAGLPVAFDGLRIVHLSDLHIGTLTPRSWGERWVRAACAVRADVAVVTGDMVSAGTAFHDDIAEVLAGLWAKLGVFVSLGNHDYFGDPEPLVARLRRQGACVLRNEGVSLERDGATIYLAGIDDTWTRRDDLPRALAAAPAGATVVLLAHDPERFRQAATAGVALTLAGHTHGGQIAFPFLSRWLSLSTLTHHFHNGLYRSGGSTLFVHPGLGTTGPPMRLGVAPTVALLTLRRAAAAPDRSDRTR